MNLEGTKLRDGQGPNGTGDGVAWTKEQVRRSDWAGFEWPG